MGTDGTGGADGILDGESRAAGLLSALVSCVTITGVPAGSAGLDGDLSGVSGFGGGGGGMSSSSSSSSASATEARGADAEAEAEAGVVIVIEGEEGDADDSGAGADGEADPTVADTSGDVTGKVSASDGASTGARAGLAGPSVCTGEGSSSVSGATGGGGGSSFSMTPALNGPDVPLASSLCAIAVVDGVSCGDPLGASGVAEAGAEVATSIVGDAPVGGRAASVRSTTSDAAGLSC